MNRKDGPGIDTGRGYSDLDFEDVFRLPPETRFIDVRQPEEFVGELGHLDRAELHPLAGLLDAARLWDKGRPLLVICRSGGRSARAATALAEVGFSKVYSLRGGMLAVAANSPRTSPAP